MPDRERRVIKAAKVWRTARHTEVCGGTYHQACRALDQSVAALIGELDGEPVPPPTEEDLRRSREIVKAAKARSERLWAEHFAGGEPNAG